MKFSLRFFVASLGVFIIAQQSRAQNFNWDGDNASGDFLNSNNWYGDSIPSFSYSGSLIFNYRNNASQTSQYYNFAGWANANDIIWETTWGAATTFNGNGQGINFKTRIENKSSYTVTIGTMNLSGGKDGATEIQLNPVNGDLTLNGNIYNDNNVAYRTYGGNSKLLTVNTTLSGNANVAYSIEGYSKVLFTAAQGIGGSSTFDVKTGELWIGTGGSLTNGMRINLGLNDANTAKFYLTGSANDSHNITVANNGGIKVVGTLGSGGATNTFSGNITNNSTSGGVLLENTTNGVANFTGVISGTGSVQIGGGSSGSTAATVILAGANTFSGPLYLSAGVLSITNANSLGTGGIQFGNAGTLLSLLVNSNVTVTNQFRINNTATNGAINVASGTTTTISGQLTQDSTKVNTTKFGKDGAGTLILNNSASDFNGQLQIGQGTVILGANNALGTNISTANRGVDLGLNVGDTSTANNVSLLASNDVTVGQSIYVAPNASSATRTIGLSGNGTNTFTNQMYLDGNLTVSVGTATTDQTTISGAIINTGGLIKTGSGNLILSGANTYSGGTTISAGTLQIGAGSTSGSVSGAITNNGTLVFNRSDAVTLANVISGTGAVTKASGSGNLTLSGANTFSGKVTVSSGTLTASGVSDSAGSGLGTGTQVELGSGANLQVTVGAGTTNTTARSLIFNGDGTLGASTGTLVWNGNTTFNASTARTFYFNSSAGGTNVFGGIIGNTTNNSAVGLNFQNTQIWSLTGSNTFTGGITIGGGKVMATTIADTGTASSVGAGGTIRFGYFNNGPSTFEYVGSGSTNNRQIKLGASAGSNNNTATFLQNGTGALVFNNSTFTLSGDIGLTNINRTLVLGGTNTLDNAITGVIGDNTGNGSAATFSNATISITKADGGKWILAGANTYSGGTTISAGTLQIGNGGASGSVLGAITNNSALILNRSDAYTLSNVISGSGTLTKASGSGNLTLSGANTFSGNVTVGGGTLAVSSVADSGSSSLGTGTQVTLGGSSTLEFTGSSSNSTTRALVLGGAGGNALRNTGSGALVWNGNVVNNMTANGADLALKGTGAGVAEFAGLITNNGANTLRLMKTEAGTWKVSGANTFTGNMDIFNGTLQATTIANSGTASSIGAGTTIRFGGFAGETGVLEYVGSGSTNNKQFKLGGGGTANTGGTILNNGTGALVFNNATFNPTGDGTFSGTTRELTLGGTNAADNTISGIIANNGGSSNVVSVVKTGTGKWVLSGANSYSGGTVISNGTLQIGAGGASGSVQGAITNNGTLILSRSDTTTVSNVISGSGALIKTNANTLTLSGANTFSGNVTVGGGTLAVSSVADAGSSSLGTGTQVTLGGSSTLEVTGSSINSTTRALVLGGTGGNVLRNMGSGALVWNGNVVNNMTANGADLSLNGTGAGVAEFAGLLANNGTNALRVIKNESGTWKLSGANTFTGYLDLFNGTLQATTIANSGSASSVGAGTQIRFGGFANQAGVLEYVGTGSTNNKQFKLGGGGTANTSGTILNNGTGALVFNNATFNPTGDGTFSGTTRELTLGGTNAADNTISGIIANNGGSSNVVSVVKTGTGKWVLSGANSYSGGTVHNSANTGTLIVRNNSGLGSGAVTLGNGNTLAAGAGITLGNGITIGTGGGTLGILEAGTATFNGTITINDSGTSNAATLTAALTNSVADFTSATFAGNSNNILLTGLGQVKLGAGPAPSVDYQSFAGTTELSAGAGVTVAANTGTTAAKFILSSNSAVTFAGSTTNTGRIAVSTGNTGRLIASSNTTVTYNGELSKDGSTLVLAGGTHVINGSITGSSTNSDLVVSNSTTTINSTNSYNGPTFIVAGGTLNNGTNNALPTDTALTLGQSGETSSTTNTYNLNGYSQTVASVATAGSSANVVTNSTGTGNLTLNSSTAKSISNLTMGGTGLTLTKAGANTVTLASGNNIAPGTIAIQQGTLLLGASNQIGNSTEINLAGGTFALGGNTDTVGRLTVSANSIFDFGTSGGSATSFTFSDFNTSAYGANTYVMTINNAVAGSSIVWNTNYSGDTTFNSFANKIQFGTTGQFGQISFSGGQTTLLVAIPDARVYSAAVALLILIGATEWKRRRGTRAKRA